MKHAKKVFLLNYSKDYIFALPTDWQNRVVLKHLDSDCKRHHKRMVCYPALGQMILVCTHPTDLKVNSQHKVLWKENYKCSTDRSIEMMPYTDFYCVKSRSFLKYWETTSHLLNGALVARKHKAGPWGLLLVLNKISFSRHKKKVEERRRQKQVASTIHK